MPSGDRVGTEDISHVLSAELQLIFFNIRLDLSSTPILIPLVHPEIHQADELTRQPCEEDFDSSYLCLVPISLAR